MTRYEFNQSQLIVKFARINFINSTIITRLNKFHCVAALLWWKRWAKFAELYKRVFIHANKTFIIFIKSKRFQLTKQYFTFKTKSQSKKILHHKMSVEFFSGFYFMSFIKLKIIKRENLLYCKNVWLLFLAVADYAHVLYRLAEFNNKYFPANSISLQQINCEIQLSDWLMPIIIHSMTTKYIFH